MAYQGLENFTPCFQRLEENDRNIPVFGKNTGLPFIYMKSERQTRQYRILSMVEAARSSRDPIEGECRVSTQSFQYSASVSAHADKFTREAQERDPALKHAGAVIPRASHTTIPERASRAAAFRGNNPKEKYNA